MTYTTPVPITDGHLYTGSSLELRNLTMAYGDIEVLRDVSLEVAPGTIIRVHRQVLARVVEDEPVEEAAEAPATTDEAGDQPGEPRDRA